MYTARKKQHVYILKVNTPHEENSAEPPIKYMMRGTENEINAVATLIGKVLTINNARPTLL